MAWTQRYPTIRIVAQGWAGDPPRVLKPSQPYEITNDACARSSERWTVRWSPESEPQVLPWYSVITDDDRHATRVAKLHAAERVRAARDRLHQAEQELRRLTA